MFPPYRIVPYHTNLPTTLDDRSTASSGSNSCSPNLLSLSLSLSSSLLLFFSFVSLLSLSLISRFSPLPSILEDKDKHSRLV
ncbi:hypothetical protein P168DRAFT_181029 [Aspergillus campestris IBT 28561]|uniref:Uncharacterized protein n=1 Tax=Aspergillus campestris (strain IBT 28561) TaxID=1392248 RepID=A0A2I1D092_ASPC2|nr:uncharacterized protein P168DRAFT_181029 [Aspergillus campestris IBT 28561]PKY03300.1 hypothetical protein P168DRAFT_181029 [Aspergillus campestris IBT 28561]